MAEALPAQAQHEPKSESSPGLEARVSVSETTLSADIATLLVEDDSTTGQPKDEHDGQGSNDAASEYDDGSDKDDDKYRLESAPDRHRQISDKKRLDTAAFQSWMEKHQRDISKPDATQSDRHSVAHMIGNSWSNKIIASPREYQIDLFERAKAKNTIVVLDTGAFTLTLSNWTCHPELIACRFWENSHLRPASKTCPRSRARRPRRWKESQGCILYRREGRSLLSAVRGPQRQPRTPHRQILRRCSHSANEGVLG